LTRLGGAPHIIVLKFFDPVSGKIEAFYHDCNGAG
jgi:hypothetical protein